MRKSLTLYITEAMSSINSRIEDFKEIKYEDGVVINVEDLESKFKSCCMYIFQAYPFFAPAIKGLTPIWTTRFNTMATDGIRLFMNPRFTYELTDEQCIFVLLHECMHCVLNHMSRGQAIAPGDPDKRCNIAADYEVNGILEMGDSSAKPIVRKGTTKSLGGLIDDKYEGWAFERIYADISANAKTPKGQPDIQSGQGQAGGQGGQDGNQPKDPDFVSGWNKALEDYNSGKLKI